MELVCYSFCSDTRAKLRASTRCARFRAFVYVSHLVASWRISLEAAVGVFLFYR